MQCFSSGTNYFLSVISIQVLKQSWTVFAINFADDRNSIVFTELLLIQCSRILIIIICLCIIKMKGIVLLINEPPNNRKFVVYKYTPLDTKQTNKLNLFPRFS